MFFFVVVSFWFNTIIHLLSTFCDSLSNDKYERKRMTIQLRESVQSQEEESDVTVQLRKNVLYSQKNRCVTVRLRKSVLFNYQEQNSQCSEAKSSESVTMTWRQIVRLRKSVLFNFVWQEVKSISLRRNVLSQKFDVISNNIVSKKRTMQSYYISISQIKSSIKSSIKLIISHFFHFIDTSFESSTVKSHRYWVNEIAIWDERFETSVRRQWRNYSWLTVRVDNVLRFHSRLSTILRRKILASWCILYSIVDIRFHIDVLSHEDAHSERRNSSNIRSIARSYVLKSILRHIWSQ